MEVVTENAVPHGYLKILNSYAVVKDCRQSVSPSFVEDWVRVWDTVGSAVDNSEGQSVYIIRGIPM